MGKRWTFDGHIAGIGAQSGLRAVVGVWHKSPLGAFADVMVQLPDGQRIGSRTPLGFALRAVPRPLAVHPVWLRSVDPLAGLLSPGARTSGTAGNGRRESYGVTDVHCITEAHTVWEDQDQGALAPVMPAVTFGFSSVPAQPGIARVRTTIVEGPADGDMSPSRRANK
ncbi:hypothetical protein [Arthrobacter sp. S39]|uniref:hypothetical protein n=1 Tax=Arthrobacter sp. S39 TaxID=2509720 RepID=UPI001037BBF3|nr:hypothetical protein [Arthrobacter sp. S39]TAP45449.1 hypothetical protein EYS21_01585 [Arthrobacter sp. S39]